MWQLQIQTFKIFERASSFFHCEEVFVQQRSPKGQTKKGRDEVK